MKQKQPCPFCEAGLIEAPHTRTIRRGGRELEVTGREWRCPNEHPGDDHAPHHAIISQEQAIALRELTKMRWREAFGEELPPSPARRARRLAAG